MRVAAILGFGNNIRRLDVQISRQGRQNKPLKSVIPPSLDTETHISYCFCFFDYRGINNLTL
jgi:hypothetical protein